MGGRVSVPRGGGGATEASKVPASLSQSKGAPRPFNRRRLLVPVAGATLAAIFFVYSRTSIQAAKENARRHREADGGSISWRNESLRRHGTLERPQEQTLWQQLSSGKEDAASKEKRADEVKRLQALGREAGHSNPIEEGIRNARGNNGRSSSE